MHKWKLEAMKQEKTNGAKVSRFDVREEYARIESERISKQPPINPEFAGGVYTQMEVENHEERKDNGRENSRI